MTDSSNVRTSASDRARRGKRGFTGAMMRGFGARDHIATVTAVERRAPKFLRLWMTSPTLFTEAVVEPAAWLRLWFPDHEGGETEFQRGYTIAEGDASAGEFAIDFVLHEPAGPASAWAASARPGDSVPVMTLGSTSFEVPDELPAGYLLIGDAASIPAISSILGVVPNHVPIEVYLEQHDDTDLEIPLTEHPGARVHWVPRQGAESLAASIEARDWSDWYAWIGAESASLKHLRTRLRDEFGFPKTEMHALAYWIHGRAMGKRRGDAASAAVPATSAPAASIAPPSPAASVASASVGAGTPATPGVPVATVPTPGSAAVSAPVHPRGDESALEIGVVAGLPTTTPTYDAQSGDAAAERDTRPGGVAGETDARTNGAAAETVPPAAATRGVWQAAGAGRLVGPLRRKLIAAGIATGLLTLLQLAPYVLLVELARQLLAGGGADTPWTLGLWAVGLMGAGALGESALLFWLHAVDATFSRDLRQRLLGKLARLPLGWFDARNAGQVKQLVQDDTLALHYLVTHAVPDAVAAAVAPIAVLGYLLVVDWRLALLMFVPVLVYVVSMWVMIVASGSKIGEAQRWAERMNGEAASYLAAQPVVRVFGGAAASAFSAKLRGYIGFLNDWQRPFIKQKTVMDLSTRPGTFLLIIVVFGTLFVAAGTMDPLAVLPFLFLGTTFGTRLLGVGYGLGGLRAGLLAARRIQATLDADELATRPAAATARAAGAGVQSDDAIAGSRSGEGAGRAAGAEVQPDGTAAASPTSVPGSVGGGAILADDGAMVESAGAGVVEFDRVGFAYRRGAPVLTDVSLTLEPGTVTALVGPSGAGKSTMAALLARFHDVTDGAIRVGGRDVRELTADELYARVGFVFQNAQLVQGSVRDNIALAAPSASIEQVEAAARAAQIHDRVVRMPAGYDTLLGPDAALSGGERQRIAIARAILADTPVLVLDEATAFADPESEYQVQEALNRLTAGRTVLVIAHRLHTITGVDRIVVLDHGVVAETGTHDELLARGGRYRQLWDADPAQSIQSLVAKEA